MGLIKKVNKRIQDQTQSEAPAKTIGKITSDTAASLIKELSGGEVRYSKKLIDNIIVFSNASGGTGASTLVNNIAWLANNKGLRVAVIDLNIMTPIQHLYLGVKQEIQKTDFAGYLLGKNSLGEAIEQTKHGISLMYANNRGLMETINCETDQAVANYTEAIMKLRQLYDIVLIDCPMQINNMLYNTAFYLADTVYLVWDESIGSIANTEKIRRNLASSGIDTYTKMRVILNKRTTVQYTKYPFEKLNIELAGILPFESDIIQSSLKSEIFVDKGSSRSKNSGIFYNKMVEITDKILEIGGYTK